MTLFGVQGPGANAPRPWWDLLSWQGLDPAAITIAIVAQPLNYVIARLFHIHSSKNQWIAKLIL